MARLTKRRPKVVREIVGGEVYEYVPLGKHIVSAKGVCGGRPTFKYTRVEVRHILNLLAHGWTVDQIIQDFNLPEKGASGSLTAVGNSEQKVGEM